MPYLKILIACLFLSLRLSAQTPATLTLKMNEPGIPVSPKLYGLMTEEINYSYDGGLYGELIRNRAFQDSAKIAAFWSLITPPESHASITLDKKDSISRNLPVSLRLDIEKEGRAAIANEGYWGIPINPSTTYKGSFYAKITNDQPLTITLESTDGKTIFASTTVPGITAQWQRYNFTLTTAAGIQPTKDARFVIAATKPGSYWFNLVSLFPPTFKDRPNGNRPDIMQLLADMQPAFLRFPGGNYLEGQIFSTRFDWKRPSALSINARVTSVPGNTAPPMGWAYWNSWDGVKT